MSLLQAVRVILDGNRERTLATIAAIEKLDDPQAALAFRPGPGRAHIAWQLMHIAVTEEMFATERFFGTPSDIENVCRRFQGGSSPSDEDVPTLETIVRTLADSRTHFLKALDRFSDSDLDSVPTGLSERGWTLQKALTILSWHEGHHQGQAHLTLNVYRASLG